MPNIQINWFVKIVLVLFVIGVIVVLAVSVAYPNSLNLVGSINFMFSSIVARTLG